MNIPATLAFLKSTLLQLEPPPIGERGRRSHSDGRLATKHQRPPGLKGVRVVFGEDEQTSALAGSSFLTLALIKPSRFHVN